MELVAAGLVALLLVVLNAQPTSRVVLLPDADGTTGSVVVRTEHAEQVLATPYGSASVSGAGAISQRDEAATTVTQRYAAALAARPRAPASFVLYFEFGSAVDIAPAFKPVLDQLLAALSSYPAPEITVIGHTDRVGSLEANDLLSLQRARTVRDLLLQAGFGAGIVEVAGRGEREPLVATDDEVAEQRNRRVEINLR